MDIEPVYDAPSGNASIDKSATKSVSLDDAFLTALQEWDTAQSPPTTPGPVEQQDSPLNTQQAIVAPQESQLAPNQTQDQEQSQQDMQSSDQTQESADSLMKDSGDYRQLYEQVLKEKDAQMGLLYSRLNELSSQYQTLKQEQEKVSSPVKKEEVPAAIAPEVQELYDLYPEVAKAVEKLVESKTRVTPEVIEQVIAEKAKPVTEQLKAVQLQQYANYIMQKHPDLPSLLQSNALRGWVNTLDPVQQKGANYIMQYGSADEVISLLDTYKQSKGVTQSGMNQQTTNTTQPVQKQQQLVNKVISAMNVPNNSRQEPSMLAQQKPAYANVHEAFDSLARDYETRYMR